MTDKQIWEAGSILGFTVEDVHDVIAFRDKREEYINSQPTQELRDLARYITDKLDQRIIEKCDDILLNGI